MRKENSWSEKDREKEREFVTENSVLMMKIMNLKFETKKKPKAGNV